MTTLKDWPKSTNPFKKNPPENTVAIIMPVRSQIKFIRLAFYSIRYFTNVPYMLVFVNNQSNLETKSALIGISKNHGVWFLDNHIEFNKGMLCNFGLEFCFRFKNVKYGCVIDSDVVVGPDWMNTLIGHLELPNVGLAGPRSHGVSNINGTCMAFRREVWEQNKGFDDGFIGGGYEDYDFILRAKKNGWVPVADENIPFHHFGGMTRQFQHNHVNFENQNRKRFELRHPVMEGYHERKQAG